MCSLAFFGIAFMINLSETDVAQKHAPRLCGKPFRQIDKS
jgi:hypothetical protein